MQLGRIIIQMLKKVIKFLKKTLESLKKEIMTIILSNDNLKDCYFFFVNFYKNFGKNFCEFKNNLFNQLSKDPLFIFLKKIFDFIYKLALPTLIKISKKLFFYKLLSLHYESIFNNYCEKRFKKYERGLIALVIDLSGLCTLLCIPFLFVAYIISHIRIAVFYYYYFCDIFFPGYYFLPEDYYRNNFYKIFIFYGLHFFVYFCRSFLKRLYVSSSKKLKAITLFFRD